MYTPSPLNIHVHTDPKIIIFVLNIVNMRLIGSGVVITGARTAGPEVVERV